MVAVLRRIVAACAVLALMPGAATLCSGWQMTSEARLDCCASGACARQHTSASGADVSTALTQAEADDCCARSESQQPTGPIATGVPALPVPIEMYVLLPPSPLVEVTDADWPATLRVADHVSRHVLLSVFIL